MYGWLPIVWTKMIYVKNYWKGGSFSCVPLLNLKETRNSFSALRVCFDFPHTALPFQPFILFFVGFQATVATIATITQSPSFQLKYITSKFSEIFSN